MRMTVIGTGYLGATHAACMAELGHEVLGVDVDERKIEQLKAGKVPFYEPGLPEVLERNIAAGRLDFTTDYARAAEFADVHFIGVGTPQQRGSYAADTRYVEAVIDDLVPQLRGRHIIYGKSTVPVGTAAALQERANTLATEGTEVEIAWNPEFLREGYAVKDTIEPDRIVLGTRAEDTRAEEIAREVYATPLDKGTPFIVTDLQTAELVKVSANAFLATKISFINAVSEVCEIVGADVTQLADAIGYDDRIGRKFLGAGLGFGGGCLPKDIRAFMARAGELGADQALTFLREVDAINMRRRQRVVDLAREELGSLIGRRITVLGAAFKPNSDDVRDSPALAVAGQLSLAGAAVRVFDPEAMDNARRVFPTLDYASSLDDALTNAELIILATEWQQFRDIDPVVTGDLVDQRLVIDGRNVLNSEAWNAAGWKVRALGRG
ncbi:UDP-glucose/GDP-mannose dehydrogenase family protein [Corynebacterium sanguinis]|uniref:UDP-glucose dehydrogenase family protein n=1 Tax=Corynebacterium sanguinis TaxID=2594913 RepID=UPI00223B8E5A|nr:UDP-glucose/GDP-mannose dehydrogenase family protein [Corynebacterium sanguinis]MCT1585304.1 UDP-glucose/GDP-mannose dehydrogenase family protein [Corynebacterium sanguinis]MCT1665049.1 UDP-glucose/GDP-mannose dehydrogenase family protein [Corynebacterium sanguinis]MCT2023280.1 UDP-glucose/GDP-mannose dehydrogenase family protein [Corynebacterium sanguinis]MCT2046983.1 UDP-glucose/GDP-mannose dehydrogenase family protein [Corynebacterium sanguinis]MCT2154424.1 UDP-glucose/GDP-mannose dehydr